MERGFNALLEGVTLRQGSIKRVLPPSYFAEAAVGFMKPGEIKKALDDVIKEIGENPAIDSPAIRKAIKKANKTNEAVCFEDLEEMVRKKHEEMSSLLTDAPVKQADLSGAGFWYFVIRRRGNEKKERERHVTVALDPRGNILNYFCICPTFRTGFAKGNYDKVMGSDDSFGIMPRAHTKKSGPVYDLSGFQTFITHIACYHVAAALTWLSNKDAYNLPFKFTKKQIFEALFAMVSGNGKRAAVDDYLIRQDTLTEEAKRQIAAGTATIEAFKHSKNISTEAKSIIQRVRVARRGEGYDFAGFATDFRGTEYQTTSIVLAQANGRTAHIIYDGKLGIKLPLLMLNTLPHLFTDGSGKQPDTTPANPLASIGKHFIGFEERIRQETVSVIRLPESAILRPTERPAYTRLEQRIKH